MLQEDVSLLDESLEEEKITNDALTELAKAAVNQVDTPQSDLCRSGSIVVSVRPSADRSTLHILQASARAEARKSLDWKSTTPCWKFEEARGGNRSGAADEHLAPAGLLKMPRAA